MSLNLDKRQRAMLREMGVRVWQPAAPPVEPQVAIESVAANSNGMGDGGNFSENKPLDKAVAKPAMAHQAPAPAPALSPPPQAAAVPQPQGQAARSGSALAPWHLGEAQALYAETAQAGGACWLVLAETPAAALQGPLFHGDAGKLLDNMLRAARLNRAGAVLLAPLVRHAAAAPTEEFLAALSALVARAQPDVVLVMGRLAAQALLQSAEPFGKLRGRVHALHGANTILTYDATYLLRSPADKAKAWDDLCLATSLLR